MCNITEAKQRRSVPIKEKGISDFIQPSQGNLLELFFFFSRQSAMNSEFFRLNSVLSAF